MPCRQRIRRRRPWRTRRGSERRTTPPPNLFCRQSPEIDANYSLLQMQIEQEGKSSRWPAAYQYLISHCQHFEHRVSKLEYSSINVKQIQQRAVLLCMAIFDQFWLSLGEFEHILASLGKFRQVRVTIVPTHRQHNRHWDNCPNPPPT